MRGIEMEIEAHELFDPKGIIIWNGSETPQAQGLAGAIPR